MASSTSFDTDQKFIKALVLDFDSTISTPTYLNRASCWAVADNIALFESMTLEEIIANFGGKARVAALEVLLTALEAKGVVLHIVSIGHKRAFSPHLQAAGLLKFFAEDRVWGQDCASLREVGFVKGQLIAEKIMTPNSWQVADVLFVDVRSQTCGIELAHPRCYACVPCESLPGSLLRVCSARVLLLTGKASVPSLFAGLQGPHRKGGGRVPHAARDVQGNSRWDERARVPCDSASGGAATDVN